jgi:signal transduction histidine kinase
VQTRPTMPLPRLLRSSPLMDLGLLAAASFAAGAFWEGPGAVAALLAGGITIPRLGRARMKETRRHKTLRRLIAQRRLKPPGQPPAGMVEELKTPLNAIISFSALLANDRHGPLTPAQDEYVQSIHAAGRQLKMQLDAMLELERIRDGGLALQEGDADPAELVQVAMRICQPEARAAGVLMTFAGLRNHVEVEGDLSRLQQILTGLILAAIADAPKASPVRVSLMIAPQNGLTFLVETGTSECFPVNIRMKHAAALAELHAGKLILEPGAARFILPAARVRRG